tara:strand:- start:52 stop:516 length:465 start_codon:yes stop_codon:yes gene_type:complete
MNRQQMRRYSDKDDRRVVKEFFRDKLNTKLVYGGHYDVDLKGADNGRPFDIEISHLSFPSLIDRWKQEGRFRIEVRKRNHYWNGVYNKSHITHFVQMNKYGNEWLVYPQELIMKYSKNEVYLDYLQRHGFTRRESTFMWIPFSEKDEVIRHLVK